MPNVIININLKHRSFFPNHQAILRSYFKKICFPEPSDKMPDDLEFGSDISSLQQTTFARNVRSFTTNFGSTLTIRILIPNIGELIDINILTLYGCFPVLPFLHVRLRTRCIESEQYSTFPNVYAREKNESLKKTHQSRRTKLQFGRTLIHSIQTITSISLTSDRMSDGGFRPSSDNLDHSRKRSHIFTVMKLILRYI